MREWKSRLPGLDAPHDEEVELGTISGVFGVRGELRLLLHNRESAFLSEGRDVRLVLPDDARFAARLTSRPGAGKRILGRIDGIDRREWAEELVGARIVVGHQGLPEPGADEYYLEEVVGMHVVCGVHDFGEVVAIHTTGPIEVFELASGAYLPSTGEHIEGIDREAREVHVFEGAVHEV